MVFKILIAVVFVAELIITYTLIRALLKFDNKVIEFDDTLEKAKPSISDISVLARKISSQFVVFAYDFRYKIKREQENMTMKVLNKILIALLFIRINSKALNKIRKSKWVKRLGAGFAFLESMV